jgi:heterokaryon incompatibility protein (HET)
VRDNSTLLSCPIEPRLLINTVQYCLVTGENKPYAALNYKWGNTKTLKNSLSLVSRLLKPGALRENDLRLQIPATIRDAIELSRLSNERYLWVDAICIIQDDEGQKMAEIRQIHRIYNTAAFTIVAADGIDADHGLRGLHEISSARQWE